MALDGLARRPWLLAAALVPLLAVGYLGYSKVQSGFMPKVDEGGFIMDYYTAPGTSLDETGGRSARSTPCCTPIRRSTPSRGGSAPVSAAGSARATTATISSG